MMTVMFLPIAAAGIAAMCIGWIWYHPRVFGGALMRASSLTPDAVERARARRPLYVFLALLAGMLVAYVMNFFGIAWNVHDAGGAVQLGFWCWLGFALPALANYVLWEHRPVKPYLIHALYWLVAFLVIAFILLGGALLQQADYQYGATGVPSAYGQ